MAGGFGGDYDEEQSPNEEEQNIAEQAEQKALEEQERIKEIQKQHYLNALKKIETKLKAGITFLLPHKMKTLFSASRFEDKVVKSKAQMLKLQLLAKKAQKWMNIILPNLPYILMGILIIVGVIVAVLGMAAIFEKLNPFGSGGMSSVNGIKGEKFYGARLIYKDEQQAKADIIENYANLIGGATASVALEDGEIAINLTVPENYDYNNFNETTFPVENADLFAVLNQMATTAYSADNGAEPTELTFAQTINGIKYFGIEVDWNFAEIIANYINTNNLYTYTAGSATLDETAIEAEISADISTYFSTVPLVRTEKLYIEDKIFSDAEGALNNIEEKQYVSLIFMPKTDVTFTDHLLVVSGANFDTFSAKLVNGEKEILLEKSLFATDEESGNECYEYATDPLKTLSESTTSFADIDKNNLTALSQAKSLVEIVNELDENIYLTTLTAENGTTVYTPKMNGFHVDFNSDQPFKFAEGLTRVK